MTYISKSRQTLICILVIFQIVSSNNIKPGDDLAKPAQAKTQDELYRTLSKSKASVWVDTNKGNVFSTSRGSSNLERKDRPMANEPSGHSNNMLLTLLIQPDSNRPITAVPQNGKESNLKPILLLLQQQHDMSGILLEKQEKLEKMNIQLQSQIKNQHSLVVDLLDHIKVFLEVVKSPSNSTNKLTEQSLDSIKRKLSSKNAQDKPHTTSSSSTANAIVTRNSLKKPEERLKKIIPKNQDPPPLPSTLAPPLSPSPSPPLPPPPSLPPSPPLSTPLSPPLSPPPSPPPSPPLSPVPLKAQAPLDGAIPPRPVVNPIILDKSKENSMPTTMSSVIMETTRSLIPVIPNKIEEQTTIPSNIPVEVTTQRKVGTIRPFPKIPRRSKLRFTKKDPIQVESASNVKGIFKDSI